MSLSQWLGMALFILSTLSIGTFRNSWTVVEKRADLCENYRVFVFLCGQKMALKDAKPQDLALIDGISLKGARRIADYVAHNNSPKVTIDDLVRVKGIGKKTLEKLKIYFY